VHSQGFKNTSPKDIWHAARCATSAQQNYAPSTEISLLDGMDEIENTLRTIGATFHSKDHIGMQAVKKK